MPIAALPKETAQRLTSSLALNDAASVVKELVDNALDSRADTVSIELSVNTLDVIQVKDNGSGIGVEDRQLLCKRGCTSKIRTFEDLASLGGAFLGFRGEALASVAELSGSVTVTTRIEGEVVATALKFGWDGKLLSSSSASHPVGTTVRVQNFLSNIPVRKQSALKTTSKTITKIQKLLRAYSYARPEVRLSFKVLKAKDGKANWNFAPSKSSDSLLEIAVKIAGKQVADQCRQHAVVSGEDKATSSHLSLQALVISPTSDVRRACNADQYFSVDNRPVSADKGLMKEFSKTYKQYLRSSLESWTGAPTLTNPFLVLRISCPPDSYDVNVEPAKDELIFCNSADLRDLFITLVRDIYGDLKEEAETIPLPKKPVGSNDTTANSFDLLLATKPNKAVSLTNTRPALTSKHSSQEFSEYSSAVTLEESREAIDPSAEAGSGSESPQGPKKLREPGQGANHAGNQRVHVNIVTAEDDSLIEDEDITLRGDGVAHNNEPEEAAVRNPWSLAKLNIRIPPKRMCVPDQSTSSVCNFEPNEGTKPSGYSHRIRLGGRSTATSPTRDNQVPFQNPGPPMRPWAQRLTESDDDSLPSSESDLSDSRPHKTGLDTWIQGDCQSGNNESLRLGPVEDQTFINASNSMSHGQHGSASITGPHLGRMIAQNVSRQQRLSLPFKTPFKQDSPRQCPSPVASSDSYSNTRSPMATVDDPQAGFHRPSLALGTPLTSSRGELEDILQFERRKRLVTAQHRKQQAMKSNWKTPSNLPSPSSHPSASGIDGAAIYAAAFSRATSRPGSAEPSSNQQPDFESRFGTSGSLEQELFQQPTPPRSNPHHNRYLAATRNLSRPHSRPILEVVSHTHPEPRTAPEHDGTALEHDEYTTELPNMPDSDPRAYFMRFRQQQHQQARGDTNGLTRTGPKIRRAKTVRLPLEAIPVGAGVHDLAVEVRTLTVGGGDQGTGFQGVECMRKMYAILEKVDEYVKTGDVGTLSWSPFEKDVEEWEMTVKALVETKYCPQAPGGVSDGDTGVIDGDDARGPFEFELNLSRALKAYVNGDLV